MTWPGNLTLIPRSQKMAGEKWAHKTVLWIHTHAGIHASTCTCAHTHRTTDIIERHHEELSLFPSAPFSSSHEGTICPVTARTLPLLLRCETWCVWLPGLAGEVSQCSLLLWTGMGKKSPRACPERCAEDGSCSLSLRSLDFVLCELPWTRRQLSFTVTRWSLLLSYARHQQFNGKRDQTDHWPHPHHFHSLSAPNRLCHSVFETFVSLCRRPGIGKLNISCQNTECRSQCILSVFNGTQRKGLLGFSINRARFV